jgi:hypothetical protein
MLVASEAPVVCFTGCLYHYAELSLEKILTVGFREMKHNIYQYLPSFLSCALFCHFCIMRYVLYRWMFTAAASPYFVHRLACMKIAQMVKFPFVQPALVIQTAVCKNW